MFRKALLLTLIVIYHLIGYSLLPFFLVLIIIKAYRKKDKLTHFREYFGFINPPKNQDIIWIHSVSVGETKLGLLLMQMLKIDLKQHRFAFTSSRFVTIKKLIHDQAGDPTPYHYRFPIDLFPFNYIFLKRLKPKAVIFVEKEIYPFFLWLIKYLSIPVFLFNTRLSSVSLKKYQRLGRIYGAILNQFDAISVQYQSDYDRLQSLGASPHLMHLTGNAKADLISTEKIEAFHPDLIKLKPFLTDYVWCAGSIRYEEEEDIIDTHNQLTQRLEQAKLILAPRHFDHLDLIEQLLQSHSLAFIKLSNLSHISEAELKAASVLIVDQIGLLSALYSLSSVSLIGGTFKPFGGQNVIEPFLQENAVIIGPYYFNFEGLVNQLILNDAINIGQDKREIDDTLFYLLTHPLEQKKQIKKAICIIDMEKGACQTFKTLINPYLEKL